LVAPLWLQALGEASEEGARIELRMPLADKCRSPDLFLGAQPADGRSTYFVRGLLWFIPGENPPRI